MARYIVVRADDEMAVFGIDFLDDESPMTEADMLASARECIEVQGGVHTEEGPFFPCAQDDKIKLVKEA